MVVGGVLDLPLLETFLDGGNRPSKGIDPVDERHGISLDRVGERLDVVGAGERIDDVGHAGLVGEDLLGAQRDPRRLVGRQRQRLVVGVGVQRLRAAEDRRQRLEGGADDVVAGLLSGERRAGGLRVKSHLPRCRVLRSNAVAHEPGPHPARGPVLGDLLEDPVVRVPEERDPRGEDVHIEADRLGRFDVGEPVGDGERHLLHRGGARLAHVIAADRDRVPRRQFRGAIGKQIGDQAHRGRGRKDVGAARHVLLEDVVLDRAPDLVGRHPLFLGHELVEEQQRRRRRVDRHRRRDLAERDAVEQAAHVLDGVDRHADLADLPVGERLVRVDPHLRREVERHRQPGLTGLEEVAEPLVGLFGGPEPGVLAHRPRSARVHRLVGPPRVRVRARLTELRLRVPAREGVGPVDRGLVLI